MSRYTTDRNGVTIGWDNCFSFRDEDDVIHSFNAILVIENMYPEQISTINYKLRSFADQLIVDIKTKTVVENFGSHQFEFVRKYKVINPWFKNWLDKHTPGYGIPPTHINSRESFVIFFDKVTHARMLRSLITKHLLGMPAVRSATLHSKRKKPVD